MENKKKDRSLNLKIKKFLEKDESQFSQSSFDSTHYLVNILQQNSNKQSLTQIFEDNIKNANEADTLIQTLIDKEHQNFNTLMQKPKQFGEIYEYKKKLTNNTRRKIQKCKTNLTKKQESLQKHQQNLEYNTQIQQILQNIQQIQNKFQLITSFISQNQFFKAAQELKTQQKQLQIFDQTQKEQFLIKNLITQQKQKQDEIFALLKHQISLFQFYFKERFLQKDQESTQKKELMYKNKFLLDRFQGDANKNTQFKEMYVSHDIKEFMQILKENFAIDLDQYEYFQQKLQQIQKVVTYDDLQGEEGDMNIFNCLSQDQLCDFIDSLFSFSDYDKIKKFISYAEKEDQMEHLVQKSQKNELLNFFLALKTAQNLNNLKSLMKWFFDTQKSNLDVIFRLMRLFFLKSCIQKKKSQNEWKPEKFVNLFGEFGFFKLSSLENMFTFFKSLACLASILIKKYILLQSVLKDLDFDICEESKNFSFGFYTYNLFHYISDTIHYFLIRPLENQFSSDFRNESTQYNFLEQGHISEYAQSSLLFHPFVLQMSKKCFNIIIDNLQTFINNNSDNFDIEDIHHEDMDTPKKFTEIYHKYTEDMIQANKSQFMQFFTQKIQKMVFSIYANKKPIKEDPKQKKIDQENQNIDPNYKILDPIPCELLHLDPQQDLSAFDKNLKLILTSFSKKISENYFTLNNQQLIIEEFCQIQFLVEQLVYYWNANDQILNYLDLLNMINFAINTVYIELKEKVKDMLKNSIQQNFLKDKNIKILGLGPGYQGFKYNAYKDLQFIKNKDSDYINSKQMQQEYEKSIKFMYQDYFNRKARADKNFLLNRSQNILKLTSFIDQMSVFIQNMEKLFKSMVHLENFDKFIEFSKQKKEDIEKENQHFSQEQLNEKKLELLMIGKKHLKKSGFLVPEYNNYDSPKFFEEDWVSANYRFMVILDEIQKIQEKIYFSVKTEVHFQLFSFLYGSEVSSEVDCFYNKVAFKQNIQGFYNEFLTFQYNICEIVNENCTGYLLDDFAFMFQNTIIDSIVSVKRAPQVSKLTQYLKDTVDLIQNLKNFEILQKQKSQLEKSLTNLKLFFELQICQEENLEGFIRKNSFKYKQKDIELYFELRPDLNKQVKLKRQTILENCNQYFLKNIQPSTTAQIQK